MLSHLILQKRGELVKIAFSPSQRKRRRLQKGCDRQEHSQCLLTKRQVPSTALHSSPTLPRVQSACESEQVACGRCS